MAWEWRGNGAGAEGRKQDGSGEDYGGILVGIRRDLGGNKKNTEKYNYIYRNIYYLCIGVKKRRPPTTN